MATELWFRCYTEIKRDRKLRRLPINYRWIWVAILAMAKESPIQGQLLISENIPATIEDIADEAAADIEETEQAIQKFIEQDMMHEEDGVLILTNWDKRQYASDSSTERVRKHRQQKNETLLKRYSNGEVTPPEAEAESRDQRQSTETEKEEEEEEGPGLPVASSSPTPLEHKCLKILKKVTGYPFDAEKDAEHLRILAADFPDIDILTEMRKWQAYKLDHPLKKSSNPRLQLRRWFENAEEFLASNKPNARAPCEDKYADLVANRVPLWPDTGKQISTG